MKRSGTVKTRTEFILKTREHLKSMRAALKHEAASEVQAGSSRSTDGSMDSGDLASEELEQHMTVMLSERGRERINKIDDALRRIDDASYGVCDTCGLAITGERLKAVPFTKLCRDCQQDQEREEKTRYDVTNIEGRRLREFTSDPAEDEIK
jgi:DnaK suppressor protein